MSSASVVHEFELYACGPPAGPIGQLGRAFKAANETAQPVPVNPVWIGTCKLKADKTCAISCDLRAFQNFHRAVMQGATTSPKLTVAFKVSSGGPWIAWTYFDIRTLSYVFGHVVTNHKQTMVQAFGSNVGSDNRPCLYIHYSDIFDLSYRGKGLGNAFPAIFEQLAKALGATAIVSENTTSANSGLGRYERHFGADNEDGNYLVASSPVMMGSKVLYHWTLVKLNQ